MKNPVVQKPKPHNFKDPTGLVIGQLTVLEHAGSEQVRSGPKPKFKSVCRVKGKLAPFTYNGIDRVDSDGDYTIDNCVPCCKICNRMKVDTPVADFIAHLIQIYAHLGLSAL